MAARRSGSSPRPGPCPRRAIEADVFVFHGERAASLGLTLS